MVLQRCYNTLNIMLKRYNLVCGLLSQCVDVPDMLCPRTLLV
jgi:hypothetical protein